MKKVLALVLSLVLCLSFFAGCSDSSTPVDSTTPDSGSESVAPPAEPVTLTVVTTFGGDDGNRGTYEKAIADYQAASGNTIDDQSGTADEAFKTKITTDFSTGNEPDVLFHLFGEVVDQIADGKFVDLDTIKAVYPDYASNMDASKMAVIASADGKNYAVPAYGYWEGLFYNKTVLEAAGVAEPSNDYSWDQFLQDCEAIKGAGYVPVALSLTGEPHYWFEYCVMNNAGAGEDKHGVVPVAAGDQGYKNWVAGINDMKALYDAGYLPDNATTLGGGEHAPLVADGAAAFDIDGSWKMQWYVDNANIEEIGLAYPPAKGDRKATDVVGGVSSGWMITKKCWDDPKKQAAAVDFVSFMTENDRLGEFATKANSITYLTDGFTPPPASDLSPAQAKAASFLANASSVTGAAQDHITADFRAQLFEQDIAAVCAGNMTAEAAIDGLLERIAAA